VPHLLNILRFNLLGARTLDELAFVVFASILLRIGFARRALYDAVSFEFLL
jgi:hypothetical protein